MRLAPQTADSARVKILGLSLQDSELGTQGAGVEVPGLDRAEFYFPAMAIRYEYCIRCVLV